MGLPGVLIHSVYFWFKDGLSPEQRADFDAAIQRLGEIESISAAWLGSPAAISPRPTVDASYDVALTLMFADITAHDAYQQDPIHMAFIAKCRDSWSRVQIYDNQAKGLD